jgi:hypothetical protein
MSHALGTVKLTEFPITEMPSVSFFLGPNIFLSTLLSNICIFYFAPGVMATVINIMRFCNEQMNCGNFLFLSGPVRGPETSFLGPFPLVLLLLYLATWHLSVSHAEIALFCNSNSLHISFHGVLH